MHRYSFKSSSLSLRVSSRRAFISLFSSSWIPSLQGNKGNKANKKISALFRGRNTETQELRWFCESPEKEQTEHLFLLSLREERVSPAWRKGEHTLGSAPPPGIPGAARTGLQGAPGCHSHSRQGLDGLWVQSQNGVLVKQQISLGSTLSQQQERLNKYSIK